jgi:hypothetical protein
MAEDQGRSDKVANTIGAIFILYPMMIFCGLFFIFMVLPFGWLFDLLDKLLRVKKVDVTDDPEFWNTGGRGSIF